MKAGDSAGAYGPGQFRKTISKAAPPPVPLDVERSVVAAAPRISLATCIKVALIDCFDLSRDCIMCATSAFNDDIVLIPFGSIREYLTYRARDIDIVIYYCHDEDLFDRMMNQEITTLRQAFSDIPIIVLSDAKLAFNPKIVRDVIRSGARAFIPTRAVQMSVVSAAIRYVKEGGTVVPVDILLGESTDQPPLIQQSPLPSGLTSRQMAVLGQLRQGKANKIIAHDLRMSESTVKVHIRNIMRKVGATNRTQAVYKSHQICSGAAMPGEHA